MSVTAKLNYLRIAPRKVRLLADLIRGKMIKDAQTTLSFVVKKSATPLLKLLNQAVANAQNNFQLDANNLYISKITVDEGPKLKRWRPRARGQTYEIQKKTSHITIILEERVSSSPPFAAARVLDEKIKTKKKPSTRAKPRTRAEHGPGLSRSELLSTSGLGAGPVPHQNEVSGAGVKKASGQKQDKFKPQIEEKKPKIEKGGIKRIFRRKAF